MGGGFFVVYLVNEMGVVQTKETRRTAVASTPPAPLRSTATAAPVPHHTPPSAPALVGVELAEMAKRDGHAVADTGAAAGIDAVAEDVVPGSEVNGGVGEDGRDQGGTEVEGDGEDDGDRSESSGEGKELEVEAIPVGKKERTAKVRALYPRRPGQPDCTFYVESGYCKFKADCKFNHPPNRRGRKGKCKKQPDALQVAGKEKDVAQQSVSQAEYERKHRKQHDASQVRVLPLVPEKEKYAVQPNMTQGVHEKASEMIGNLKERDKRIKYPQRPDAIDCSFYMKTGECKFGSACIFNHPSDRKHNKIDSKKQKTSKQIMTSKKDMDVKEKLKEASSKRFGQKEKDVKEKLKETPTKSFGQKGKDVKEKLKEAYPKSFGEMEKDAKKKLKEASSKSFGQKEKTYTTPGACKISKQSNDHGVKEASSVALNFLNLPIRPGAEECSEYMREGSCKFGINCRHHHPDPTATNTPDLPSQYEDSRLTQQFENGSGVSPSLGTSWHASTSYTTGMHLPYVLYPNPEWNEYQVPMPQPEIHIRNPSAFPVNHAGNNANMIMHQQAHIDYPERPGQPECHYFKKTGACKFRSVRKFHHPKDQLGRNTNSSSEPKQLCEFVHRLY